jgi:hypothetical protein
MAAMQQLLRAIVSDLRAPRSMAIDLRLGLQCAEPEHGEDHEFPLGG